MCRQFQSRTVRQLALGQIYASTATVSTLLADSNSWFAIEEPPSDLKNAIGLVTADQAIPSGTNYTGGINMDAEFADTSGWFNAGDDHFTVPAGISKIRFGFSGHMNQWLGSVHASIGRNGSTAGHIGAGFAQHAATSDGIDHMHEWSGILDVVPGDAIYSVAATNARGAAIASPSFWQVEEYPEPDDIPVMLEPGAGALTLTGYTPLVSGGDTARNRVTLFIY